MYTKVMVVDAQRLVREGISRILESELDIQVPAKDNFDAGVRDTSLNLDFGGGDFGMDDTVRMADDDGDVMMNMGDGPDRTLGAAPLIRPARISESPLSDIDEAFAGIEVDRSTID